MRLNTCAVCPAHAEQMRKSGSQRELSELAGIAFEGESGIVLDPPRPRTGRGADDCTAAWPVVETEKIHIDQIDGKHFAPRQ